ncbi:MAG: hypothetical protein U0325_14520 [Polyangiales bacterium]
MNPLSRTLEVLALGEAHHAVLEVFAGDERVRAAPSTPSSSSSLLWEDVVLG